jgi:transposase
MKIEFTLGIDMAKDAFVAVLIDRKGKTILPATTFSNNTKGFLKLLKAIPQRRQTNVLLESTGVYGKSLIQALSSAEGNLFEVNPLIIKRLSPSMVQTKTDQADAVTIAQVGRWLATSQRETLEKYRVKYDPHRENLALWIAEYKRLSSAKARLEQQIANVRHHTAPNTNIILQRRLEELQQIKKQLKITKKEIDVLLKEQNDLEAKCLKSIIGVGTMTTATALVSIQNINRFKSADALKAYWGMYPKRNQSGKREGRSKMAKHGNKLMRHMLWNAAKSAARHNPVCKELFERLVAKGKTEPAAYGAVARKLVQIIYGVLKSKTMFQYLPQST